MIALQLSQIAAVTEGVVHSVDGVNDPGALVVDGPVVTDSRLAGPGGMYVARLGEHNDGHDFVADAADGIAVPGGKGESGRAFARENESKFASQPLGRAGDHDIFAAEPVHRFQANSASTSPTNDIAAENIDRACASLLECAP